MAMFEECRFCHQFFSKRGLLEHIQWKHRAEAARADKKSIRRRTVVGVSLGVSMQTTHRIPTNREPRLLVASENSASLDARKSAKRGEELKSSGKPNAGVQAKLKDPRIVQGEREQKVRSFQQAVANKNTATYIKNSALQKLNAVPLGTIWKEQVAKLSSLKRKGRSVQHSYALQLQKVPPRNSPPPFDGILHREKAENSIRKPSETARKSPIDAAIISCTCGGENERCFRCFGKGYYEVSPQQAARMEPQRDTKPGTKRHGPASGPASFASDDRGGSRGLREQGRFASEPAHDDYGEDSTS